MMFVSLLENVSWYVADTVALAAVALIGYLFGSRTSKPADSRPDEKLVLELSRTVQIANELRLITQRLRQDVALHQSSILQFESRVKNLRADESGDIGLDLSSEAEAMLAPTLKLATKLSLTYDQIRKQSSLLSNFADSHSDPETGVLSRKAMEEHLKVLASQYQEGKLRFALGLFRIDCDAPVPADNYAIQDQLQNFAQILERCAQENDLVARFSKNEFIVLMPEATMASVSMFGETVQKQVEIEHNGAFYGGIVEGVCGESVERLLSRADSALYSARVSENGSLYQHTGKTIRPLGLSVMGKTLAR